MPVEYHIVDNGIYVKATGAITGSELFNAKEQFYMQDIIASAAYQLVDFSGVETIDLSSAELRDMISRDIKLLDHNPGMLIALAGTSDLVFGLGRMWESYIVDSALRVAVFRRVEQACDWLAEQLGHDMSNVRACCG